MDGVAHGKFSHNADGGDVFFFQGLSDGTYFRLVQGRSFPAPVVDGALYCMVVLIGAVPFRIDARAGRDDESHGIHLVQNNGVGSEGGADDHPFDVPEGNIVQEPAETG